MTTLEQQYLITKDSSHYLSLLKPHLMKDEVASHLILSTLTNISNLSLEKKPFNEITYFCLYDNSEPQIVGLITPEKRFHIVALDNANKIMDTLMQYIVNGENKMIPKSLFAEENIARNFTIALKSASSILTEKIHKDLLCSAVSSKPMRLSFGKMERANINDKKFVSIALAGYMKEFFPNSNPNETQENIEETIRLNSLYIWRSNDAVAIAELTRETPNTFSITSVYTLPEYRNRGYAKSLVKSLMDLVLIQKKYCLLFSSEHLFKNLYSSLAFSVINTYADYRYNKTTKRGVGRQ